MDNNSSVLQVHNVVGEFGGFYHLARLTEDNTSPEKLGWLWKKLSGCEYAFDDFTRDKIDFFLEQFANESVEFYEIEKHGLFIVRSAIPAGGAEVHYVVWNPEEYGLARQKIAVRELFDYLFYDRRVHHVYGTIPVFNHYAVRLATAVGMKYEGEIREAFLWKGKYFNQLIYGILEGEWKVRRVRV